MMAGSGCVAARGLITIVGTQTSGSAQQPQVLNSHITASAAAATPQPLTGLSRAAGSATGAYGIAPIPLLRDASVPLAHSDKAKTMNTKNPK